MAVLGSCPALESAADAGSRVEASAAVMARCDVAVPGALPTPVVIEVRILRRSK